MSTAAREVQRTMKNTLAGIGIHLPEHRKRAIAIGERLDPGEVRFYSP